MRYHDWICEHSSSGWSTSSYRRHPSRPPGGAQRSPSSAAGVLRPPGRRHDGTWWVSFGIITSVDLVDSCSAAELEAGSRGDRGGAINHDHGRVDRALAGHNMSTRTSDLRARPLLHQYLIHPLSLQHLVCRCGQTRCSGGISTARAARGRAPMMAPVCFRPCRTSRQPTRALAAVAGAADRRCTPSPRTGPRGWWWPTWLGLPQWAWTAEPCDLLLVVVAGCVGVVGRVVGTAQ